MAYLDQKDQRILEHLFQDARLTTKDLAKLAGITQPAAHKRLKRLEREKYIERYDAIVNYQLIPLTKKAYLCNLHTTEINHIKKQKECVMLLESIGPYTHHLVCWFKNVTQQRSFEKFLPKKRKECELTTVFTKGPSLFDLPLQRNRPTYTDKKLELTKADVAIIKAISEGGARKTLLELSNQTGLSIDIIHYRKKRLIQHGYFSYFVAQPGFGALHLTVSYLYITTNKQTFANTARSPLYATTNNGIMIAFLSKDIDDFHKTLDKIYQHYQHDMTESILLTNKNYILLNRYPYEFLIKK